MEWDGQNSLSKHKLNFSNEFSKIAFIFKTRAKQTKKVQLQNTDLLGKKKKSKMTETREKFKDDF